MSMSKYGYMKMQGKHDSNFKDKFEKAMAEYHKALFQACGIPPDMLEKKRTKAGRVRRK